MPDLSNKQLAQSAEAGGVEVTLPIIKLNLKEFVALRNIHNPPEVTCHPESRVINQLLLLGLIEWKMVPPCPKKIAKVKELRKQTIAWFKKHSTEAGLDQIIDGVAYGHKRDLKYPETSQQLMTTKAGVDLLHGRKVSVVMPKPTKANGVGCP